MSRIVYLVSEGDYSDYSVVGIYDREEDADLIAQRIEGRVEEWPMNTFDPSLFAMPYWTVTLYDDGDVKCNETHDADVYLGKSSWRTEVYRYDGRFSFDARPSHQVSVQAPHGEAAVKIAAEKVAQYKAEQAGIA